MTASRIGDIYKKFSVCTEWLGQDMPRMSRIRTLLVDMDDILANSRDARRRRAAAETLIQARDLADPTLDPEVLDRFLNEKATDPFTRYEPTGWIDVSNEAVKALGGTVIKVTTDRAHLSFVHEIDAYDEDGIQTMEFCDVEWVSTYAILFGDDAHGLFQIETHDDDGNMWRVPKLTRFETSGEEAGALALNLLKAFLSDRPIAPNEIACQTGVVLDVHGAWHAIDALPDDLHVQDGLWLGPHPIPARLKSTVSVYVSAPVVLVPADIRVGGIAVLNSGSVMLEADEKGDAVHPGCLISFHNVAEVRLPTGRLSCDRLSVSSCRNVSFPASVTGDVQIVDSPFSGVRLVTGNLVISARGPIDLHDDLVVTYDMEVEGVRRIGDRTRVGGDLRMVGDTDRSRLNIGQYLDVAGDMNLTGATVSIGQRARIRGRIEINAIRLSIGREAVMGSTEIYASKIGFGKDVVFLEGLLTAGTIEVDLDTCLVVGTRMHIDTASPEDTGASASMSAELPEFMPPRRRRTPDLASLPAPTQTRH